MTHTEQAMYLEEITNYIIRWAALEWTGTGYIISIWEGPAGLTHTHGSMEYRDRDNDHEHIVTIELLNEFAPYSKADVKHLVEFKFNENPY